MRRRTRNTMSSTKRWSKFARSNKDRDGQWLVMLRDGTIHLGRFYCGAFVKDGFCYNDTPGIISEITHIKAVKPC